MKNGEKKKVRIETVEEREKRLAKNKKARAAHWRKTGVSEKTIKWMDDLNWL